MEANKKLKTISEIVVKPGISYSFDTFTQAPTVIPYKYKELITEEAKLWIHNLSTDDTSFSSMTPEEQKGAKKILIKFFDLDS